MGRTSRWLLSVYALCSAIALWAAGHFGHVGADDRPSQNNQNRQVFVTLRPPSPEPESDALPERGRRATTDQEALRWNVALLKQGLAELGRHAGYTAQFYKQERIDGELRDGESIRIRVREEPFSVHMRWDSTGKEALYIQGRNDGKVVVRPDGWRRIFGRVKLDPEGSFARAESRYPITESGLTALAERLLLLRQQDVEHPDGVTCRMVGREKIGGRECWKFVIEYRDSTVGPGYRKAINYLDTETGIPIAVNYYGWAEENTLEGQSIEHETLLGHYVYNNIAFDPELSDADFRLTHR